MRTLDAMFKRGMFDMRPYKGQQLHHEVEVREIIPWWGATGWTIILPVFTTVEDVERNGPKTILKFKTPDGAEIVVTVREGDEKIYVDFDVTKPGDIKPGWWFAWVSCGSHPTPSKGPFRSVEEARKALQRFRERHGALAGTYESAGSLRLKAYPTREAARKADISDNYPVVR